MRHTLPLKRQGDRYINTSGRRPRYGDYIYFTTVKCAEDVGTALMYSAAHVYGINSPIANPYFCRGIAIGASDSAAVRQTKRGGMTKKWIRILKLLL